ncbi:MAG TPA: UvrD-helicase domain-containing protein, partial [Arenimonas sp.]|nr:UvrD-helicase domain-containing protein [Arenimonas sp.]
MSTHTMNAPQKAAVEYTDGPLLVLAGAGSGKTRVITEKIAHLISHKKCEAKHIAAITFTNKSAREMRERVSKRIKSDKTEGLTVSTFHSLGLRFLQIEAHRAKLRRGFSIFDTDDQLGIIKDLSAPGLKNDALQALHGLISQAKNNGLSPDDAFELAKSAREREAANLYDRYQARLQTFNAVDFDDLIRIPLMLLDQDPDLAPAWRERLRYLLVDECQDTNGAQYRLLKHLAGPNGRMTCVGDDDQSIYAWRGAQPENLELMAKDYPNLKVIKLEQNYRCTGRILRSANQLIAKNPHVHLKNLWSQHGDGEPIRIWGCTNNEHEAERVAAEIHYLKQAKEIPWGEFAILFRGNHQSRVLEKALQLLRIPYHLTGGTAFLDRGEVKDTLSWLRVLANPDDDAAFLRAIAAPKREVGGTSIEKLAEMAKNAELSLANAADNIGMIKQLTPRAASGLHEFTSIVHQLRDLSETLTPAELTRKVIEKSGLLAMIRAQCKDEASYLRRKENLEELAQWFEDARGGGPGELAAQLALISNADRGEPGNQVRLMSLHAAKGLEFRVVFLVGLEDGNLPHEMSMEEGGLEEERRLMYVGITRAKERLYCSHSAEVKRWGAVEHLLPSRFLD